MKKIISSVIMVILLVCISMPVVAANKNVVISSGEASAEQVVIKGTTEALAVNVQLRSADGNDVIAMITVGTQDGKYTAKINNLNLVAGKSYAVYIADYEGGDWTVKEVKVPESTTPGGNTGNNGSTTTNTSTTQTTGEVIKSPKTGLDPMVGYGAIAFVLIVGGFTMWFMLKHPTHK